MEFTEQNKWTNKIEGHRYREQIDEGQKEGVLEDEVKKKVMGLKVLIDTNKINIRI